MTGDESDRIAELLAERALGGLTDAQEAQLRSLRPEHEAELDDYELAAAALLLALNDRYSPLPKALRKRLEASALDQPPPL